MCINQCLHSIASEQDLEKALEEEKRMEAQKVNSTSTRNLNKHKNFLGCLGQYGVINKCLEIGIAVEWSPYFNSRISSDKCDFSHKGTNDIKTSPLKDSYPDVLPNSRLLLKLESKDKKVDWYTFVKVSRGWRIHIVGVISYEDFWSKSKPFENAPFPCNYIWAKDTKNFIDYLI